jgi:hypothetical protein
MSESSSREEKVPAPLLQCQIKELQAAGLDHQACGNMDREVLK